MVEKKKARTPFISGAPVRVWHGGLRPGWKGEFLSSGTLPGGGTAFTLMLSVNAETFMKSASTAEEEVFLRERRGDAPAVGGSLDEMPDLLYIELYPDRDEAKMKLLTSTMYLGEDGQFHHDYFMYDATADISAARRTQKSRGGFRSKPVIAAEIAADEIFKKWQRAPFSSGEHTAVPEATPKMSSGEWARLIFPTPFQGVG